MAFAAIIYCAWRALERMNPKHCIKKKERRRKRGIHSPL